MTISHFRSIAVLFFMVTCSSVSFSDEAFDFFVETCRHSGYNPLEIATFQAELKVVTQTVYPDSTIKYFKGQEEKEPLRGNEEQQQKTKKAREESFNATFSGEPDIRFVKASLRNSAASLGLEDTLAQAKEVNLDGTMPSLFQIGSGVRKHSADGSQVTVVGKEAQVGMHQFDHFVIVTGNQAHHKMNYHLGGRSKSVMTSTALEFLLVRDESNKFIITDSSIAALKNVCEKSGVTFVLSKEKVQYAKDCSASILNIYEKGKHVEQLWIDPDRGYICPKETRYDILDGAVKNTVLSEDFFLDERSQKWFPKKVTHSAWMGQKDKMITYYSEAHILPGTLILNQPIPDSVFSLTVPKGTEINDVRREDKSKKTFIAQQPRTLTLSEAEKKTFLDDAEEVVSRPVREYYAPPVTKAPFRWVSLLFMSAGIILIVLGLVLKLFKK